MITAATLIGLIFPFSLLALVAAACWFNVFNPPYLGKIRRSGRVARRRRLLIRWYFLTAALCGTVALAALFYVLLTGQW